MYHSLIGPYKSHHTRISISNKNCFPPLQLTNIITISRDVSNLEKIDVIPLVEILSSSEKSCVMDQKKAVALWLLYRTLKKKRCKNRRMWVHPINQRRLTLGVFYTLFNELREDGPKFFNYFRLSMNSFDELHGTLRNTLQLENTEMRDCIDPMEMSAVTLRYVLKILCQCLRYEIYCKKNKKRNSGQHNL